MNETIIEVKGLTKYYGALCAVNDVSFALQRGEVYGLLGRNGAGKTTTMKMLLGLLEPTRGHARIFGQNCNTLTPALRRRVAFLAEGHHLYNWMRIGQAAAFTCATNKHWDPHRYQALMDYFDLSSSERIRALSNGQRAQVSLALALACKPELLIMDDPTLGVDAAIRQDFLRGIIDMVAQEKCTILLSTHILADVDRICDRIGIMDHGVLRANCSVDSFKQSITRHLLRFGQAVPHTINVPRLVCSNAIGNELQVTVSRHDADTEKAFHDLEPDSIEKIDLTLEEAFVDYTTSNRERRLFLGDAFIREGATA